MISPVSGVEFVSASTAGIVNVQLGYTPDFAILVSNHGGTNPNLYVWVNTAKWANWPAALDLLLTGSTGVVTRDTTGITAYGGGEEIAADETDNTAGKHINRAGAPSKAGTVTTAGVSIPADHQANSGRNLLLAFRVDN